MLKKGGNTILPLDLLQRKSLRDTWQPVLANQSTLPTSLRLLRSNAQTVELGIQVQNYFLCLDHWAPSGQKIKTLSILALSESDVISLITSRVETSFTVLFLKYQIK